MTETHSPLIQTEDFIRSGFFPKELVPAFTTEGLANNLDQVNDIVQATLPKHFSQCSYYSFPKSKYSRRNLAIPNPLHQIILCNTLSDNSSNSVILGGNNLQLNNRCNTVLVPSLLVAGSFSSNCGVNFGLSGNFSGITSICVINGMIVSII